MVRRPTSDLRRWMASTRAYPFSTPVVAAAHQPAPNHAQPHGVVAAEIKPAQSPRSGPSRRDVVPIKFRAKSFDAVIEIVDSQAVARLFLALICNGPFDYYGTSSLTSDHPMSKTDRNVIRPICLQRMHISHIEVHSARN